MAEITALNHFFRTLDTELERVIEAEDLLTRATDPLIPSHEAIVAAAAAPLDPASEAEVAMWDNLYEEQYWEELSAKFRPHFFAAVTLLTVAVLEAGLARLSRFLQVKHRLPLSAGQLKGSTLDRFRLFARLCRWRLPSDQAWSWASDLYLVRNALIHEAGSLYELTEVQLAKHAAKLCDIARRRRGLEVERVHQSLSVDELFSLFSRYAETQPARKGTRKRKHKPAQLEGVTVTIQREFCATALQKTREILSELYSPLLENSSRDVEARSQRHRR